MVNFLAENLNGTWTGGIIISQTEYYTFYLLLTLFAVFVISFAYQTYLLYKKEKFKY